MRTQKTRLMIATAAIALFAVSAPAAMAQTTSTSTTTKTTATATDAAGTTSHTTITSESATPDAAPVRSEMKVKTTEKAVHAEGTHLFNLADFDINKDGVLSTPEVGEKLFAIYDADGNGMIDNIEYEKNVVVTVLPVEKTTTITYDFDGDGVAEQHEKVHETFLTYTQLARFDGNKDGLSAREFTGRGYLEADIDGDQKISKKEWQGTYIEGIDRSNKIKGNLNK